MSWIITRTRIENNLVLYKPYTYEELCFSKQSAYRCTIVGIRRYGLETRDLMDLSSTHMHAKLARMYAEKCKYTLFQPQR
jgi:hypothetical protein